MPLEYCVDTARGIVTITGDYAEAAEWKRLLGAVAADPDYRPGFGFLRDLRTSTHPVSVETVFGIIAVVREFWPLLQPRRAAIVTGRVLDHAALAAHALADQEHIPLRAFTYHEDALAWLLEKER